MTSVEGAIDRDKLKMINERGKVAHSLPCWLISPRAHLSISLSRSISSRVSFSTTLTTLVIFTFAPLYLSAQISTVSSFSFFTLRYASLALWEGGTDRARQDKTRHTHTNIQIMKIFTLSLLSCPLIYFVSPTPLAVSFPVIIDVCPSRSLSSETLALVSHHSVRPLWRLYFLECYLCLLFSFLLALTFFSQPKMITVTDTNKQTIEVYKHNT